MLIFRQLADPSSRRLLSFKYKKDFRVLRARHIRWLKRRHGARRAFDDMVEQSAALASGQIETNI